MEQYTIEQLKVMCFDEIKKIQIAQHNIKIIEQELEIREKLAITPKKEE